MNNAERSVILGGFAGFTFQWGIALLFLLAGAATWFGLRSRGAIRFARMRAVRLGVPLIAGLALLSPLQSYFQHAEQPEPGGLLHAYLTFWSSVHASWSPSSAYDYVYHLWFLTHLLAISLLTLPIAAWLRSSGGARMVERALPWIESPAGFLLGAVPLAAVQMALHAKFPHYQDWSDLGVWAVLYLEGFLLVSARRIQTAVRRWLGPALVTALIIIGLGSVMYATGQASKWDSNPDYSPMYLGYQGLRALSTWSWVVVVLAAGIRWLDTNSPLSAWGDDRPLPFYVLSHPIIVVLAAYVVTWHVGVWMKFAIIAVISIALALALCEIVRRYRITRLLFGLGVPRGRPPQATAHRRPAPVI